MTASNGLSPDELRDDLPERMREDGQREYAFITQGIDPYADDWDMDLSLPECPDPKFKAGDQLDAWLLVAKTPKSGRMREARFQRRHFDSMDKIHEFRASLEGDSNRLREAWGPYNDPFAYGQGMGALGVGGGVLNQYIPLLPGPVTRQLYWQDYFAMSAKAFEAYNHDPITWRAVHMKQQFTLGKSLAAKVTYSTGSKAGKAYDQAQTVWDEFWKRNRMEQRIDMAARDLSWGGEQFFRYFKVPRQPKKLAVRALDPASIYDILTDQEDFETVFGYHQQFQTPYQLYAPQGQPPGGQAPTGPTLSGTTTRYIVRQIPAPEIDHYKINSSGYERRGRSDIFPGLGWIKRLRDYLTSHVIRADMLSRICWDLKVAGNPGTQQQIRGQLFPNGQPPAPGTVFTHSAAVELLALAPASTATSGRFDPILDALVTMAANSIGVPKDWLGFSQGATRANALVATEPAARGMEDFQKVLRMILGDMFDRVMEAAGISDADADFTFPSIATEDRSKKLQDLSYAEANGWLSKQTSAVIAAKEMDIQNYDYDEEQKLIAAEFPPVEMEDNPDAEPDPLTGKKPQRPKQGDGQIRRSVTVASNRQVPKLDITKSPAQEDEPPGLLVPTDGSSVPVPGQNGGASSNGATAPSRAGIPGDENPNSAAGAANIRQDNTREAAPVFSGAQVQWLLRERRRRPDDPEFKQAAGEYRQQTAENLASLVRSAGPVRESQPTTAAVKEAAKALVDEVDAREDDRHSETRGWFKGLREAFQDSRRPEVNVTAPPATVEVTTPPAHVTVQPSTAAVTVQPADVTVVREKTRKTVMRDKDGNITGIEEG